MNNEGESHADETGAASGFGEGEFRSSGELGHGYISGVTFTDRPVTFSRIEGQAIFEGDIVLDGRLTIIEEPGQVAPGLAAPEVDIRTSAEGDIIEHAVVVSGASYRWPNGVIPFEIDSGLPQAQQTAVQDALQHWRSRTRLAFPGRTTEPDWIRFVAGGGCSSSVGRQSGRQDITLGSGCGTGQAIHEIGHSVGLWHEQSREDRDQFVTINWQNIDPAQRHNFDQHISDGDDVGEYDYGSIMHYPRDAFSVNGQDTITPKQAGVTIGQRSALSAFDTAGVRSIYPGLQPPASLTWVGDFSGDGPQDLLGYTPPRMEWWLGSAAGGQFSLRDVGSTSGFGQVGDGRPFWVGRFSRPDRDEILFYYPGDDNWWLGVIGDGTALTWSLASNTQGFGHGINDGRPFWVADFNGDGKSEVLFYYPGDDNWWLAAHDGSAFRWSFAGNTQGFGHAINDGRPFWIGRFSRADRDQVLFYYPGDDNWWLGSYDGTTLQWSLAGNTAGFGHAINDGRPFWIGDFTGDGRSDVLFYYPGDRNWWLGQHPGSDLQWSLVGNTLGFGQVWDGRPFWTGRFAQRDRDNVLFYSPGDGKYWVATLMTGQLTWRMAGDF